MEMHALKYLVNRAMDNICYDEFGWVNEIHILEVNVNQCVGHKWVKPLMTAA